MNTKVFYFLLITLVMPYVLGAQTLDGISICIDPGHGGFESDDRFVAETGFWESESNFRKALFLKTFLENLGATVVLTRTGNDDNVLDDPSLLQRVAIANANNVDYFHSIHSNAFVGTANYTLMLYREVNGQPVTQEALDMCTIMAQEIFSAHRTTAQLVRGDLSFLGYNLGVLDGLTMPGTLSEGSFHDYIPESWRLQNSQYREHEAIAITKSFLEFYDAASPATGAIAGIARDDQVNAAWYFIPGTADNRLPVNNLVVTLRDSGHTVVGDDNNNGFFLFDSLAPGVYNVVIDAPGYFADSTTVLVTAGQTVFADFYLEQDGTLIIPPATPDHIRVLNHSANSLLVVSDPVEQATYYVAYYGTDGITFPDSTVSDTNEIVVDGLTENIVYYFRVKAKNDGGSSDFSRYTYAGVPSGQAHQVLIVNGFDRSSNNRFDYIREYADPVNLRNYAFSYTLNESVIAGKIDVTQFQSVIWILGDESTGDVTFSAVEQDLVELFLKQGGNFFVSGAEIGWDLVAQGSSADRAFYQDYLKATYVADAPLNQQSTHYQADWIDPGLFAGLTDFSFDNGTQGTFDVDWPDAISARGGAQNILKYRNVSTANGVAGIAYSGVFPGGTSTGNLIYLAIPFETIYNDAVRVEIMAKTFDFFEGILSVETNQSDVLTEFRLDQNYPNPFNPSTEIQFYLPKAGQTRLKIYDSSGRLVQTLVDRHMKPGFHNVQFDARGLASGTYFYVLEAASNTISRKMILLK